MNSMQNDEKRYQVQNFERQIWQGLYLSDDFEHIHSLEHLKLRFVCGGAKFFVVVEIWYFLCIVTRIPI